ncbi:MAG: purine-nucleoside phosphorylase [Clostridia bacterium]
MNPNKEALENNNEYLKMIEKNVKIIEKNIQKDYEFAIVLGSGLSDLVKEIKVDFELKFDQLLGMPKTTIKGHEGKLIFGTLNNKNVVLQQGRIHYYEGHNLRSVTQLIRVYSELGIKKIILTNAAGGINLEYNPGDIMIIKDQINIFGVNPLIGENLEFFGERFPNMHNLYDEETVKKVALKLDKLNKDYHVGNYIYMTGPSYETPAEVNALRILGADAVGMSTVPEAIVAKHSNMKVFGVSCITNSCTNNASPTHSEVIENADKAKLAMIETINEVLEVM